MIVLGLCVLLGLLLLARVFEIVGTREAREAWEDGRAYQDRVRIQERNREYARQVKGGA